MVAVLLILVPLLSGLGLFVVRKEDSARQLALLSTIITLAVAMLGVSCCSAGKYIEYDASWLPALNSRFHLNMDGMGKILCMLTAISFPLIITSTDQNRYKNGHRFYALLLLSQAGLMGVFLAYDALLFYFFWELALIPIYFLCSTWGGEKRISVTFKFFIYTFTGSLLMLIGLIYLYFQAGQTFDLKTLYALKMGLAQEQWVFWLLFIAFAIKMPVFPFHSWQPDTYEQSPTAVTMVLSGIMVKMGVFAVIRWLAPITPMAFYMWGDTISWMAIIGMIYASLIAMQQDDLKRLVAYSSIAHIGLMVVALFATNKSGMQGVMIQMFSHGVNIIGLWMIINVIEQQYGTRKMSELGGLAQRSPALAILFTIVALANIALPLTNGFVGEFLMFNGVFSSTVTKYNIAFTAVAGLTIILSAVYTLNMLKKVIYGNTNALTANGTDISRSLKISLIVIVVIIFVMGVYPKPVFDATNGLVDTLLNRITLKFK